MTMAIFYAPVGNLSPINQPADHLFNTDICYRGLLSLRAVKMGKFHLTQIDKIEYNVAYGRELYNFCSADMPCGCGRGFLLAAHRAEDQTGANTQSSVIGRGVAGNFGCGKKYRGIVVTAT